VPTDPVDLQCTIYRAQDLPAMDQRISGWNKKSTAMVDPYVQVTFGKTKTKTKHIKHEYNPDYNRMLHCEMSIPTMIDQLKVQVYDWDMLGGNDLIATRNLLLSNMSSTHSELGFFPTFGPQWVPMYGAPREASTAATWSVGKFFG
jgi:Ca2+-dependent lipid-binding protein